MEYREKERRGEGRGEKKQEELHGTRRETEEKGEVRRATSGFASAEMR